LIGKELEMVKSIFMGAVLAALAAGAAAAQQPTAPPAVVTTTKPPTFIASQPVNEWLAGNLIGVVVRNPAGEMLGDVNDLMLDQQGKVTAVVIGVGGFLGVGEKAVAVPFDSVKVAKNAEGQRVATIDATRVTLEAAPKFVPTEPTLMQRASEKASEWGRKAAEKASELKERMTTDEPAKTVPEKRN
jgi:sporulation protein YlmC with PRC-barrel domain